MAEELNDAPKQEQQNKTIELPEHLREPWEAFQKKYKGKKPNPEEFTPEEKRIFKEVQEFIKAYQQQIKDEKRAARALKEEPENFSSDPQQNSPLYEAPKNPMVIPASKTRKNRPTHEAGKKADYVLFRLLRKDHPVIEKLAIDWAWKANNFLSPFSTILWPYQQMEDGSWRACDLNEDTSDIYDPVTGREYADIDWKPRNVRFVYNMASPFQDEQEMQYGDALTRDQNGRNQILDNPENRRSLTVTGRDLKIQARNSVLKYYLWLSGQCANMHPKARRYKGNPVYELIDFGELDREKVRLGKLRQKMYEVASDAKLEIMIPHATYLNIPLIVVDTGETRDLDAVREDYKDAALANPDLFQKTYNDPKIMIMYQITKLKEAGHLNLGAGKATWRHTNAVITLIPPNANPIEYMANYCIENEDFQSQVKAFMTSMKIF